MSLYIESISKNKHNSFSTAVILVNLGTPNAPTQRAVRRYLREFLSDTRIIKIPKLIWWWILNGIILPFYSWQATKKYAAIWTVDGSPLLINTRKQAALLQNLLHQNHYHVRVVYAMRYGYPTLATVLNHLNIKGYTRILIFPAYPQYSSTTTASIFDAIFRYFFKIHNIPELRFIKNYYDHEGYITALKDSVLRYWDQHGRPEKLIMSFHGIPKQISLLGDPYYYECHTTADLLAKALSLQKSDYMVTFQSKFGKSEWLKPYTILTLQELAKKGLKHIHVICPGFISDCLETLEEIAITAKIKFLRAGGKKFFFIPCLNDNLAWGYGIQKIVTQHMLGWPIQIVHS